MQGTLSGLTACLKDCNIISPLLEGGEALGGKRYWRKDMILRASLWVRNAIFLSN